MTTAIMVHGIPRKQPGMRLWAALARMLHADSTCDRCKRSMLDSCERRGERVCILCLAGELDSRTPALAPPELAGCAAVLRQLVEELKAARGERGTTAECAREDALLDVVLDVVWAITPPNLRVPSRRQLDEVLVCTALERYERAWGLMKGRCTLTATFRWWQQMQARAQRYHELTEVDQRYAALVRDELGERTYLRRRRENVRA